MVQPVTPAGDQVGYMYIDYVCIYIAEQREREGEREREREGGREGERHRDRQTDRERRTTVQTCTGFIQTLYSMYILLKLVSRGTSIGSILLRFSFLLKKVVSSCEFVPHNYGCLRCPS